MLASCQGNVVADRDACVGVLGETRSGEGGSCRAPVNVAGVRRTVPVNVTAAVTQRSRRFQVDTEARGKPLA
jgi:hypothetical protein